MLAKALQSAAGNAAQATYIEDVFSTYLYTGNGSTQTITNGIDLDGEGGLVWLKTRVDIAGISALDHRLIDTARGARNSLCTNTTDAEIVNGLGSGTAFNSTGFTLGGGGAFYNTNTNLYASWTFRKAPKFFDVVTYTGDGNSERAINHSLNAVPGCVIVKKTNAAQNWSVWHRTFTTGDHMYLNTTGAVVNNTVAFGSNANTSTTFNVGSFLNANGDTYVAYLFAHDAGGFGDDGTENVISCGSYTGNGSATGPVITLGWEPQWVIVKQSSASGQWWNMIDVMRGFDVSNGAQTLGANASDAEYTNAGFGSGTPIMSPTSTGFQVRSAQPATNASGETYIYIAIRRGPMKTPTTGTEVFEPVLNSGNETTKSIGSAAFPVDLLIAPARTGSSISRYVSDRLRGRLPFLVTSSTDAEANFSAAYGVGFDQQSGVTLYISTNNVNSHTYVNYALRRAPGFFDVVCYDGLRVINNTTPQAVSHNLGVSPELVIVKCRSASTISSTATNWSVCTVLNGTYSNRGYLNTTDSFGFSNNLDPSNGGAVSASSITFGYGDARTNATGNTYVAYLFATVAGVSKVGSYTGNGTSQTIDCGFTTGARFVLIKRTDSTGDWYVWDSARGIVSGNDPHLSLNTTAAEVTTDDSVDADTSGFVVNQDASTNVNVTSATYIFLSVS